MRGTIFNKMPRYR